MSRSNERLKLLDGDRGSTPNAALDADDLWSPRTETRCSTQVEFFQMVSCISRALDLMHAEVTGHHRRVATVSVAIAGAIGLPLARRADLAIAGSLHDAGAVSEGSRLLDFDFDSMFVDAADGPKRRSAGGHSEQGYRLLRDFPPFAPAAAIIRHHHVLWSHGAGAEHRANPVALESHLLHLADRIAVLPDPKRPILAQRDAIVARVRAASGAMFRPELVEAFVDASKAEAFWLELVEGSDDALRRSLGSELATTLDADQLLALAEVFGRLIDFRSPYTATHSDVVGRVAEQIGRSLGMSPAKCRALHIAGLLHDVGKLGVPTAILDKPGPLTPEELAIVRAHPFYTDTVLRGVGRLDEIRRWASHHHERVDGTGYPFRVRALELDLGARIVAVADVYSALSDDRPYRAAMSRLQVASKLGDFVAAGALDGDVVKALVRDVSAPQSGVRPAIRGPMRKATSET